MTASGHVAGDAVELIERLEEGAPSLRLGYGAHEVRVHPDLIEQDSQPGLRQLTGPPITPHIPPSVEYLEAISADLVFADSQSEEIVQFTLYCTPDSAATADSSRHHLFDRIATYERDVFTDRYEAGDPHSFRDRRLPIEAPHLDLFCTAGTGPLTETCIVIEAGAGVILVRAALAPANCGYARQVARTAYAYLAALPTPHIDRPAVAFDAEGVAEPGITQLHSEEH